MTDETSTQCVCPLAGACELMGWNGQPRAMSEIRHAQCQDPAYFAMFYAERERYAEQRAERAQRPRVQRIVTPQPNGKPTKQKPDGAGTILAIDVAPWVKRFCRANGSCTCRRLQREMDERGPDWCEANIDYIVVEMQKNAKSLGCWISLPAAIIRRKVKRVISRARIG